MRMLLGSIAIATMFHAGSVAQVQPSMPTEPNAECTTPVGWDGIVARNPRIVVFGELHGTEQAPAFVGALACALASRGDSVLLAVELDASGDQALQTAWAEPREQFLTVLASTAWRDRRDGVGSMAMVAMLRRAHALKSAGLPISVVAFNGMRDQEQKRRLGILPGQGPHEAAQAENIAHAASAGDYDRVLVLVGNLHARTESVTFADTQFEPMAKHLARSGTTLTFDMRYATGAAWNCLLRNDATIIPGMPVPNEAIDCGNHPQIGNADFGTGWSISLNTAAGQSQANGYDGIFWVGPISGSPPFQGSSR